MPSLKRLMNSTPSSRPLAGAAPVVARVPAELSGLLLRSRSSGWPNACAVATNTHAARIIAANRFALRITPTFNLLRRCRHALEARRHAAAETFSISLGNDRRGSRAYYTTNVGQAKVVILLRGPELCKLYDESRRDLISARSSAGVAMAGRSPSVNIGGA